MYHNRATRRSHLRTGKHKTMDYVMPFLIIVCVGIILVLLFNLVKSFFGSENTQAAYMHIVEGNVEMKAWGTDDFFGLTSDVLVMQGDEIRSSAGAKLIVEFFDGTIMRMDGDTVVEFTSIVDEDKESVINLNLKHGNAWFNKLYRDTGETSLVVNVGSVVASSNLASIFELENNAEQAVRVFAVFDNEGLQVDVLNEGGDKIVETEKVGVGQEILFDAKVMDRYWKYQSPTVISAVSDDFKLSDWYLWNFAEDGKPTEFEKYTGGVDNAGLIKVNPEIVAEEEAEVVVEEESSEVDAEEVATEDAVDESKTETEVTTGSKVSKPTITSVAGVTQVDEKGFYRVGSRVSTLTGSVSGASKMVVNDYVLQKYTAGNTTWSYFANADFGLMKPGENIYEVYSMDAAGVKSDVLTVKVFYTPVAPAPETVAPAETENTTPEEKPVAESSTNTEAVVED